MTTLNQIEKISIKLDKLIKEFNKKMPDGYFITTDVDGTLLITEEETLAQRNIPEKMMKKSTLTKQDVDKIKEDFWKDADKESRIL